MSLHTKLVVSILALSVLGVILLSSVLFDSHQQSNNRLHLRTLEQHVVGIAASLSRHAVEAGDSTQTLIEADRAYVESDGSFQAVVVSILSSDSFMYRKTIGMQPLFCAYLQVRAF